VRAAPVPPRWDDVRGGADYANLLSTTLSLYNCEEVRLLRVVDFLVGDCPRALAFSRRCPMGLTPLHYAIDGNQFAAMIRAIVVEAGVDISIPAIVGGDSMTTFKFILRYARCTTNKELRARLGTLIGMGATVTPNEIATITFVGKPFGCESAGTRFLARLYAACSFWPARSPDRGNHKTRSVDKVIKSKVARWVFRRMRANVARMVRSEHAQIMVAASTAWAGRLDAGPRAAAVGGSGGADVSNSNEADAKLWHSMNQKLPPEIVMLIAQHVARAVVVALLKDPPLPLPSTPSVWAALGRGRGMLAVLRDNPSLAKAAVEHATTGDIADPLCVQWRRVAVKI
jgi:hypothetical protein